MKAILVKTLPATNTLNKRLKVSAEQIKPVIYSSDSFNTNSKLSIEEQAATKFAKTLNWLDYNNWNYTQPILVQGQLPNLDHVFCIYNKHWSE